MKVTSDNTRDVVKHFRTIEIEDGPVVDGGEGFSPSYIPGTLFKVNKAKQEWVGDKEPDTVLVSGDLVDSALAVRSNYSRRYYLTKEEIPEWLRDIL